MHLHAAVLFLSLSTLVISSSNQIIIQAHSTFNTSDFDQAVVNFMEDRSIPGLSVALTYDDRLIYASGYGWADKNSSLLVTTSDRFRLASVSKSITAIAVMHLVQLGALNITDRVFGDNSVLGYSYGTKTFSDWELGITVQDLLEHSSGFVNNDMCGDDCDPTYLQKYLQLDQWDLVGALLDQYTPSHPPGTFASYSNLAYFIAGRVIEVAGGVRPYEDYVKDEILRPMGVINMDLATDERQENEVVYYDPKDSNGPYSFNVNRRDSVGAWIATPVDLVKVLTSINGLLGRKDFLDEATIALMFEKSTINNSSFGQGWDVVRYEGEQLIDAWKNGGYSGTRSNVNINFLNKTTYAIVVNSVMPRDEKFNGAQDLKALMDNLTFGIEQWPEWDLFEE